MSRMIRWVQIDDIVTTTIGGQVGEGALATSTEKLELVYPPLAHQRTQQIASPAVGFDGGHRGATTVCLEGDLP